MTQLPTVAAYEHNGVRVDSQRFYALACDPRRSVAVEACAGAGKTWMLVSRILRALLEGCPPQDILAITFTKKAAGEMRQRLQAWLLEFASLSDDGLALQLQIRGVVGTPAASQIQTLRGLHKALLQGGRPVQIRTFHSWFAALLRGAPMSVLNDLSLPAAYELLEDDKKATVQVWRRFQTRVAQDPDARADYAGAVATYGRHQAHKALEAALHKRTEFVLADAQGVVERSVNRFEVQFPDFAGLNMPLDMLHTHSVRALLQQAASALGAQKSVKCRTAASALEHGLTARNPSMLLDALFTKAGEPRKLGDTFEGAVFVAQAQDCLQRVQDAEHQHQAWLHQQRMARLVRGLIDDYAALKRERGWVDMGDLERAALVLMSDPVLSGRVQERLDARVRHLLIDEFQDTNPLQWQALSAWISGYAGAGSAPSVFIVGDPKQSIYRFRRAEPQVFQAAKAFVQAGLGGELLSCDHTRRNAPDVIALVNTVMQQAQGAGEFDGFRSHSTDASGPGRVLKLAQIPRDIANKDEDAAPVWRDSLTMPRFEPEERRKTLECRQAARWLVQQITGPAATLTPDQVMVLARKRESLGLMQAELAALHIPAQQPEKADLCGMPEVQDVVALLDVLVSPRHDLSLARVLKSPLFGVRDDDLVHLALRQRAMRNAQVPPATANEAMPVVTWLQVLQVATGLPPALEPVGAQLAVWKQWLDTLPPHDALSAIYQSGDVLARYAAAAPEGRGGATVANLNALLTAVLSIDGGRYTTAYGLVRALRAGGIAAPVQAQTDAVRLLTIHGAKGLEAPLVLLLDTDGEPVKSETMGVLVDWPGEAAHPLRFVFLASESHPPACVADALLVEQAARRREELNALYVAMTRTRQTLVISSLAPRVQNPGSWWVRLQAHAQDAPVADSPDTGPAQLPADRIALKVLPARKDVALRSHRSVLDTPAPNAVQSDKTSDESPASRIGEAMHLLLEWVAVQPGAPVPQDCWNADQMAQVATQFVLEPEQVAMARGMATGILSGEAAWAWDADQLDWYANEVPIVHRSRSLRIDRLVRHKATGLWWVLDYKSSSQPHLQAELCAQLEIYRDAVANACADPSVCAAFLTPQGALIPLPNP